MGPRADAADALASLLHLDLIDSTAHADHSEYGDDFLVPVGDYTNARRLGCAPQEHDRAALALAALGAPTTIDATLADAILQAAEMDSSYQSVLEKPPSGTAVHSGLMWDTAGDTPRLNVPRDAALRTRILAHCHDDITGALRQGQDTRSSSTAVHLA
jgi:hypothetical protein